MIKTIVTNLERSRSIALTAIADLHIEFSRENMLHRKLPTSKQTDAFHKLVTAADKIQEAISLINEDQNEKK